MPKANSRKNVVVPDLTLRLVQGLALEKFTKHVFKILRRVSDVFLGILTILDQRPAQYRKDISFVSILYLKRGTGVVFTAVS